jgi:hypothetical protein
MCVRALLEACRNRIVIHSLCMRRTRISLTLQCFVRNGAIVRVSERLTRCACARECVYLCVQIYVCIRMCVRGKCMLFSELLRTLRRPSASILGTLDRRRLLLYTALLAPALTIHKTHTHTHT